MRFQDIHKLHEKKYRKEYGLYMIQGEKSVDEALSAGIVKYLFTVESLYGKYKKIFPEAHVVSHSALGQAGTQTTADGVIALAACAYVPLTQIDVDELVEYVKTHTLLVLDGLNDPGNLGTIVRTADWFGIAHIVCTEGTVDIYNPKAIAASMGSFTRVQVHYGPFDDLIEILSKEKIPVYGAVLDGAPLSTSSLKKSSVLVMGSESHGITQRLQMAISHRITIPRAGGAESLNVSVATGIILSHIQ